MFHALAQRMSGFRTNLAFRYMPKIAEWAVWAASARAAPALKRIAPIRLLIDSNIHAHAVTHEDGWIDTGTKLWGGVHPVQTGYAARIPVHSADNDTREYRDICRLTVISTLARKGIFELYTSAELMAERTRHPPARFESISYSGLSLLDGLKIETIDGWSFDGFTTGGANDKTLKELQRERLRQSGDPLYQAILEVLGHDNHSQDAWHLRTAQIHDLYGFLTMDYKLIRLAEQHRKKLRQIGLTTKILTPEQINSELGSGSVPPNLFSYDRASFPVRRDLHWPDQRRRRTNSRRAKRGD